MRTTAIARQFLQQTLDAVRGVERNDEAPLSEWLAIHGQHKTCAEIAIARGLISQDEASDWLECAHHAEPGDIRPSPLERLMLHHHAA